MITRVYFFNIKITTNKLLHFKAQYFSRIQKVLSRKGAKMQSQISKGKHRFILYDPV